MTADFGMNQATLIPPGSVSVVADTLDTNHPFPYPYPTLPYSYPTIPYPLSRLSPPPTSLQTPAASPLAGPYQGKADGFLISANDGVCCPCLTKRLHGAEVLFRTGFNLPFLFFFHSLPDEALAHHVEVLSDDAEWRGGIYIRGARIFGRMFVMLELADLSWELEANRR